MYPAKAAPLCETLHERAFFCPQEFCLAASRTTRAGRSCPAVMAAAQDRPAWWTLDEARGLHLRYHGAVAAARGRSLTRPLDLSKFEERTTDKGKEVLACIIVPRIGVACVDESARMGYGAAARVSE